jgi:glycosyltransferase involved in cell wall biosynthesis
MRIVIDLQAAQSESRFRGIGRYSLSLAQAMTAEAITRKHEVYLLINAAFTDTIFDLREAFNGIIKQSNILIFSSLRSSVGYNPADAWRKTASEILREKILLDLNPDVVHITGLFDGWVDETAVVVNAGIGKLPCAITLFDLIPFVMSETYLADTNYRNFYLKKLESLKNVDCLLAISESSKIEAINCLNISEDKIFNISGAVSSRSSRDRIKNGNVSELLRKLNITQPYVFYVPGGFDPRKNFERLFQAFALLPQDTLASHLLVIGSKIPEGMRDVLYRMAETYGLRNEKLIFTDYISDEELFLMYGDCSLNIFPSIHEGLGLPALEAMSCGAPVVASNTTSLPEIIGLEEALFDPLSVTAIANIIERGLNDKAFNARLRKHSLEQVKNFSWAKSAKAAIDAIENIFSAARYKEKLDQNCSVEFISKKIKDKLEMDGDKLTTNEDFSKLAHCLHQNNKIVSSFSGQKQLLVDISELVVRDVKTGIQRVVRSILLMLLQNPPCGYRVEAVYTTNGSDILYANKFVAEFLNKNSEGLQDEPVTFRESDIFIGLDLTAHFFPTFDKVLKQMRDAGVRINYVVYDLTPLMESRWHTAELRQLFNFWIDAVSESSDQLICISRAVANDLKRWFNEERPYIKKIPCISYFHLGADLSGSKPTKGLPDNSNDVMKSLGEKPTFLMVGTIEPRKGHNQSLDAFEKLWDEGVNVNLVIVGKVGWNVDGTLARIRNHPELNGRLYWLEGISDEYLESIYKVSSALLVASEAEGFGLPLIEAAHHNIPIIARNLPVFKEVAQNHARYFSGLSHESIVRAIKKFLNEMQLNKLRDTKNMTWLTWKESAEWLLLNILKFK